VPVNRLSLGRRMLAAPAPLGAEFYNPAPVSHLRASISLRTVCILAGVEFEWDPEKDRLNQEKHGVSFAEASTVFGDALARTVPDPRYSIGEFRFLTTGYSLANRLLIVAWAYPGFVDRLVIGS
jgi:uncharacterized protein